MMQQGDPIPAGSLPALSSPWNRFGRTAAALALIVVAVAGILYSLRAEAAQLLYYQARYGAAKDDPAKVEVAAGRAHSIYPFNYFLCITAGESAYAAALKATHPEQAARLAEAQKWCDAGLALNTRKSQLQMLKTRLLLNESIPAAVENWQRYVDWDFWVPSHHATLVELYCLQGDFEKATLELEWIKGTEFYQPASDKLIEAWKKEMARP